MQAVRHVQLIETDNSELHKEKLNTQRSSQHEAQDVSDSVAMTRPFRQSKLSTVPEIIGHFVSVALSLVSGPARKIEYVYKYDAER